MIVRLKMSFGESINDDLYDRFARNTIRGFLKPNRIRRGVIQYVGPIGISLSERMKKTISARDFLLIVEQIVVAMQKIDSHRLRKDLVLFDMAHIYMNEVTKELQFIYVPSEKCKLKESVIDLLEKLAYSAIPETEADEEVIRRFIFFVRKVTVSTLDKVETFVKNEDKSVYDIIKKQNAGQTMNISNKRYDVKEDDLATDLLEEEEPFDDEATGLLDDGGTELLDEEATGLLVEDDDNDGTALLSSYVCYASLTRVLTGERIDVNKAVFRLGKERSYVDYFVSNNQAISRSHADIVTRGSKYFVIDLNSKNRTYINDQLISPHCETEIRNGDTLRLANEEFIFNT